MSALKERITFERFVGTDDQGHRYYVEVEIGPDALNDLSYFNTTEHEPATKRTPTLSMTYREVNPRGRRDWVSGGAGVPDLPARVTKSLAVLKRMAAVAERWHLNGMRAGCAHQVPVMETDQYGRTVPSLDLTPPCPLTGYKYGHAWLVEPLPADIIAEVLSWKEGVS